MNQDMSYSDPEADIEELVEAEDEKTGWDYFWDLLSESTLASAAIALTLVGTACYMWSVGQEVPDQLYNLLQLVVGYFFVSKTAASARRM